MKMISLQLISSTLLAVLFTAAFAMCSEAQDQPVTLPALLQQVMTSRNAYPLGAKVTLDYGIKNRTNSPITYNFSSGKKYDIWIMLGNTEVYRMSRGRMYTQALTSLAIAPGETKTFSVQWDQKDQNGKQVGPGTYVVYAQLTPMKNPPPPTQTTFQIGNADAVLVSATVKDAIRNYTRWSDRDMQITGTYQGTQPNETDPNTKLGPPVKSSDWIICDKTGCMYVTGTAEGFKLDPGKDVGTKVTLIGRLMRTEKGQVYLKLAAANMGEPKA